MGFTTIKNDERADKGVSGLSATPNLTASALQQRFDSLANLALDKLIILVQELESSSASSNIGTPSGKLSTVLANLTQRLIGIEEARKYENINSRMNTMEVFVQDNLAERVCEIERARLSEAVDQRVSEIERELPYVQSALNGINTQIENTQDDISVIESSLKDSSGNSRLDILEISMVNAQDDIGALEEQVTSEIQSAITILQAEIEDTKAIGTVIDGILYLNSSATVSDGILIL